MKYKAVKLISLQAVYDAGDEGCKEFMDEFNEFLRWRFSWLTSGEGFSSAINFNALELEFERRPKWANFLIAHGLIEKVEDEVFYSVGDRFRHSGGNEFLLACIGSHSRVQLIKKDGKGFYGEPAINVKNVMKITKEEFDKVSWDNPEFFTKIEEGKQ